MAIDFRLTKEQQDLREAARDFAQNILAPLVPDTVIAACRKVGCDAGEVAVTHLPGILLARYRGDSAEAARDYFAALWSRARSKICGRDAVSPRIWNT